MKHTVLLTTVERGALRCAVLWDAIDFLTPPAVGDLISAYSEGDPRALQQVVVVQRRHDFTTPTNVAALQIVVAPSHLANDVLQCLKDNP